MILEFLDPIDLCKFSSTSKKFCYYSRLDVLWKPLCLEAYGSEILDVHDSYPEPWFTVFKNYSIGWKWFPDILKVRNINRDIVSVKHLPQNKYQWQNALLYPDIKIKPRTYFEAVLHVQEIVPIPINTIKMGVGIVAITTDFPMVFNCPLGYSDAKAGYDFPVDICYLYLANRKRYDNKILIGGFYQAWSKDDLIKIVVNGSKLSFYHNDEHQYSVEIKNTQCRYNLFCSIIGDQKIRLVDSQLTYL